MPTSTETGRRATVTAEPGRLLCQMRPHRWLLAGAVTSVALTALAASRDGYPVYSIAHVTFWWVASVVLALASASTWPARPACQRTRGIALPSVMTTMTWSLMLLAAAIPRFGMLGRYPGYIDADEGAFLVLSLEFGDGRMANPFATGFSSNPNLYPAAESILADALGGSLAAHRMVSALIGTIGVLAAWRLGVTLAGAFAGTLGALLLAAWPLHVHFSRMALNNITDPTFLTLALLFALRANDRRRPIDAVITGLALGLGLYGYFGGRVFPFIVVAVITVLALERRVGMRAWATSLGWMALGYAAIATPLLMAFVRNPAEFGGHLSIVSTITLETIRDDPTNVVPLYLRNLADAFIYPVAGNNLGFFRHESPFIGWQLSVLLVVGLVVTLARSMRKRERRTVSVLVFPYLVLVLGIALAIPIGSQRYTSTTPLLALISAVGLAFLVSLARSALPSAGTWFPGLLAAVVIGSIAATNLTWMASENRQIETHGDYRTIMMWDIGWRLASEGDGGQGSTVLLAGPPHVFAGGFANLTFLAPHAEQVNVEEPFGSGAPLPELMTDAVLVLIPERLAERCAVEHAFPDAIVAEAYAYDGRLLYIAVARDWPGGWSMATSPAGSTFEPVTDSPCPDAVDSIGYHGSPPLVAFLPLPLVNLDIGN